MTNFLQLHDWSIRRSGSGMTIVHSTGKLADVREVITADNKMLARTVDNDVFELLPRSGAAAWSEG